MKKLNTSLDLISQQLKQMVSMVDSMKEEQDKNIMRDNRLNDHERRIAELENQNQETLQNIDYLLSRYKEDEHYKDRNEELEFLQNPYSQDGDAICNSEKHDYD